jgi:hypothetical protein
MPTPNEPEHSTLVLDLEPELRRQIETAASERGISIRDYVSSVLRDSLKRNQAQSEHDQSVAWTRLSIPSFSRDWESDADAIYDDLA